MEIFSLIVSQFPAYLYILRARHCVNFLKQDTYMPLARLSRLAGVHTFPIFYFLCLSHQLSKLYGISLWFLSYVDCFILFYFFGGVFLVDLYLLFKPSSMFCLLGNISGLYSSSPGFPGPLKSNEGLCSSGQNSFRSVFTAHYLVVTSYF